MASQITGARLLGQQIVQTNNKATPNCRHYWTIVREANRSPIGIPTKGQWYHDVIMLCWLWLVAHRSKLCVCLLYRLCLGTWDGKVGPCKPGVVMMPTLLSMAAPTVVVMKLNDNRRCHQRWQSSYHDDFRCSVVIFLNTCALQDIDQTNSASFSLIRREWLGHRRGFTLDRWEIC